jgi:hypothetical protein
VKLFKTVTAIIATIALLLTTALPANASDTIRYKTEQNQTLKKNKWVTLNFNGKTSIQGNGERSLFCYQVVINTKGKKKPKYVKVRLTRIVPGPNDSTATNTYFFTDKPGSKFVASQCWTIFTKHPVVVQVRVTGGSATYNTDISQFKMWTPGADYPEDFSDFIPETTIN